MMIDIHHQMRRANRPGSWSGGKVCRQTGARCEMSPAGARSGSVRAVGWQEVTAAPAASMGFRLTQLGVALHRSTYDLFCHR